jgi:hypothetical protein
MKLFGFYNGVYWMIISSIQELENVRVNVLDSGIEFMKKELAVGRYVFVNDAGGWHTGELEDKKDILASDIFPTINDAIRVGQEKLELFKEIACLEYGITREDLEKELSEIV